MFKIIADAIRYNELFSKPKCVIGYTNYNDFRDTTGMESIEKAIRQIPDTEDLFFCFESGPMSISDKKLLIDFLKCRNEQDRHLFFIAHETLINKKIEESIRINHFENQKGHAPNIIYGQANMAQRKNTPGVQNSTLNQIQIVERLVQIQGSGRKISIINEIPRARVTVLWNTFLSLEASILNSFMKMEDKEIIAYSNIATDLLAEYSAVKNKDLYDYLTDYFVNRNLFTLALRGRQHYDMNPPDFVFLANKAEETTLSPWGEIAYKKRNSIQQPSKETIDLYYKELIFTNLLLYMNQTNNNGEIKNMSTLRKLLSAYKIYNKKDLSLADEDIAKKLGK